MIYQQTWGKAALNVRLANARVRISTYALNIMPIDFLEAKKTVQFFRMAR